MVKGTAQVSAGHSLYFLPWGCLCTSSCCPQPRQSSCRLPEAQNGDVLLQHWNLELFSPGVDVVWHLALARDGFQWEGWVWPPCFRILKSWWGWWSHTSGLWCQGVGTFNLSGPMYSEIHIQSTLKAKIKPWTHRGLNLQGIFQDH